MVIMRFIWSRTYGAKFPINKQRGRIYPRHMATRTLIRTGITQAFRMVFLHTSRTPSTCANCEDLLLAYSTFKSDRLFHNSLLLGLLPMQPPTTSVSGLLRSAATKKFRCTQLIEQFRPLRLHFFSQDRCDLLSSVVNYDRPENGPSK